MAGYVWENNDKICGIVKTKRKTIEAEQYGEEQRAKEWHFYIFSSYIEQTTFIIDGNQILFIYPR